MNPMPDFSKTISTPILSKIQDMGRIEQLLIDLLDDPIFENLSKHDTYWHSKYDDHCDKLDDLRRKISCFKEILWNIVGILRKHEEESS